MLKLEKKTTNWPIAAEIPLSGQRKAAGPGAVSSHIAGRRPRAQRRCQRLLADGKDPMAQKQGAQRRPIRNARNTFKAVAREWHERQLDRRGDNHTLNIMWRFDIDIFPYNGIRPIADIDAPELLDVLRRIEKRSSLDVTATI